MLALFVHSIKSATTIGGLILLLTACNHLQPQGHGLPGPEKRSTEAEIRQHIAGEWTVAEGSNGCWYPKIIFAEDGTVVGIRTNGKRELLGTWEMWGTLLRATPTRAILDAARSSGSWMNDWDYFPVIYADDHELVMAPGISVAGRWRYKR